MQGSVQSIAKQRLKHAHFIFLPAIRGRLKAESGSNTAYYHQTENMKTDVYKRQGRRQAERQHGVKDEGNGGRKGTQEGTILSWSPRKNQRRLRVT